MPVWKSPTPDWMKPENASVLDSVGTRLARKLANLLGANDPNSMIPAPGIMAAGRAVGGVLPTIRRVLGDQADEFITNLGDFDLSDDGLRVIDRAVSDLIGRKQGVQAGMSVMPTRSLVPRAIPKMDVMPAPRPLKEVAREATKTWGLENGAANFDENFVTSLSPKALSEELQLARQAGRGSNGIPLSRLERELEFRLTNAWKPGDAIR